MITEPTAMERAFAYASMELPDPGPDLSPQEVRDVYSAAYPELATAAVEGPTRKGTKLVYEFRRSAGTKG